MKVLVCQNICIYPEYDIPSAYVRISIRIIHIKPTYLEINKNAGSVQPRGEENKFIHCQHPLSWLDQFRIWIS